MVESLPHERPDIPTVIRHLPPIVAAVGLIAEDVGPGDETVNETVDGERLGLRVGRLVLMVEGSSIFLPLDIGRGPVPHTLAEFPPLASRAVARCLCCVPGRETDSANGPGIFNWLQPLDRFRLRSLG